MKVTATIVFAGLAAAHHPVPAKGFNDRSHPASFEYIAALGESFHNAWKHCVDRSTTWINDELQVQKEDPAFDNGYYVEYDIMKRVPRVYDNIKIALGEDNFWPTPIFTEGDGNFRVDQNYAQTQSSSHAQVGQSNAYAGNDEKEWITEKNRPSPQDIAYFEDEDINRMNQFSKGGKLLKSIFYDIQQISYYCDFTLESAESALEKVGAYDLEKEVRNERRNMKSQWKYILKEQVAPIRWSMNMWTRYNIAEPAIQNVIVQFENDWDTVEAALATLPTTELAAELEWESYNGRFQEEKSKARQWTEDMRNWIQACYPKPDDDTIHTGDKICQRGLEYAQVRRGEKEAIAMWKEFARPLLRQYKKHPDYDEDTYAAAEKDLYESIYATGAPFSYRCVYIWIRTRVRYFEILPTWELQRIGRDTASYWQQIEQFRNDLVNEWGVEPRGIYSDEKLAEMKAYAEEQVHFLELWAAGDDEVFDEDGELHRKKLKGWTRDLARKSKKVENWYFMMAFKQFEWKDGAEKDLDSDNFRWKEGSIQNFARPHATTHVRLGWRKWCWREMVKLNFHTWRRI